MMPGDYKFGLMILGTILLMCLLVINGERRERGAGQGVKVDLKRIEKQVSEGKLSLHPAEFFKKLNSLEEAE